MPIIKHFSPSSWGALPGVVIEPARWVFA